MSSEDCVRITETFATLVDCKGQNATDPTTLRDMANPKTTIHIGIAVVGFLAVGVLSVFIGDATLPFMIAGGGLSGLGYWLGAAAQRRHG